MTPAQCRMARAALELGIRDLAKIAEVAPSTITRFERGDGLYPRTIDTIKLVLEREGIEFLPDEGFGAGVRMRRSESDGKIQDR